MKKFDISFGKFCIQLLKLQLGQNLQQKSGGELDCTFSSGLNTTKTKPKQVRKINETLSQTVESFPHKEAIGELVESLRVWG